MWPLSRRTVEQEVAEAPAAAVREGAVTAPEAVAPEETAPDNTAAPEDAAAPVSPSSAEEVLRRVLEGTGADTGHDFFRSLVRHLAGGLGVRWAFVGELLEPAREAGGDGNGSAKGAAHGDGDGNGHPSTPTPGEERVRVLAFWDEQPREFSANFDYALAGTPCEGVVDRAVCEYRSGVGGTFPSDPLLARVGAQGYLGVPLRDTSGEPLGVLVVMHDRPLEDSPLAARAAQVLRIFAARAAAELQRVRREEALQRAYESVRDSHRRHLVLADISPVGIFHTNAKGQAFYTNRRGSEMVGLPPEQCGGRGWATHLHPEDRERIFATADAAGRSGTPFQSEFRFLHPDGRLVWVFGQFVAERDDAGRIVGYAGTLSDITRLKRDEQQLRESERRYQALAESSAVGIWHLSMPDGLTLYVNPKMRQMLELDRGDDPAGMSYEQFFTPQGLERVRAEHARRAAGESSTYEVELVGRRGTRRTVVIAGTPVAGPDGTVTSVVGAFTDITERRQMEQALRDANVSLRQSETRLRLLAEQAPAVLWSTDAELRFTSSQGAGLAALGTKPGEYTGVSLYEYFRKAGAPEGAPALEAHRRALAGESCSYEQLFAGRTYQSHVEPLRHADGHIIGVVGIALDITERKRAEEALEVRVRQRTDEIAAANEALRHEIEERKGIEDELRQNQQRYASILNSQQTLISRSDPEGRITYVNAAHQRAFGSKVGDSVLAKVHPEDVEATRRAIEDLTRPPYTFTLEQRCEVRGQWRTFLWQGGVIRDRGGKVVEYQGVGFDITERKRAEEMLHDSTRRAREAAEQARDSAEDARRAAEEAVQVAEFNRRLALEVDHRVRNNLAGLLSLVGVMKERSKDVRSFATAIEGRLLAMHHVHQVLADTDFKAVDLKSLVASLLAAVEKLATFPARVRVDGPSVPVPPRQTLPLSMILVEWFSNSCKYGAHTAHGGRLKVSWEVVTRATAEKPAVEHVRLRWQEFGGPQILAPVTPSLGTDLVRGFASRELAGRCELCYPLSGVDHMLEFPVE